MEGAGKTIDDDELREAMQEKGLGTPATRAAIIEGLISEKYLLREGRELIPTAKAFQLMTLLRGLEVEELSKPELTGEWEYKLAQMEKGQLSREAFMREIAAMTERIVRKAKEFNRDSVPGDYATLHTPCPHCGGVVRENYRRYACTGADGQSEGCGFSFTKTPGGRTFTIDEAEQFLRERRIGPLEVFAARPAGPSRPSWRWSATRKTTTSSSNSILAKKRARRRPARSSISRTSPAWAPAPSAAARSRPSARAMCASAACPRRSSPRPAATSRAAR
jgi:DNA topoisomerase-3